MRSTGYYQVFGKVVGNLSEEHCCKVFDICVLSVVTPVHPDGVLLLEWLVNLLQWQEEVTGEPTLLSFSQGDL